MIERRELYNDTGYCGVFKTDLTLVWSDNFRLFRRISKFPSFRKLKPEPGTGALKDLFMSFENVKYHIITAAIGESLYICRAYPQYGYMLEDFQEDFNDIRYEALNIFTVAELLKDMKRKGRYSGIEDHISCLMNMAENIFIDMTIINQRIEGPVKPLFIHVRRFLLNLNYKLDWYSAKIKTKIYLIIDMEYAVAKIDYNIIEIGIYSLARIVYKSLSRGSEAAIYISNEESDTLRIYMEIPFDQPNYLIADDFSVDKKAVECIFKRLGGSVELREEDERLIFETLIPTQFTNNFKYVQSG